MIIVVALTAFGVLWANVIWPPRSSFEPVPLVTALFLSILLTVAAAQRLLGIATVVLIATLTATLSGVILLYPSGVSAVGFALIVLAASGAADWRYGLLAAVTGTAVVGFIAHQRADILSADLTAQALLLIWGALVLAWVAARRLRMAYAWAWHSYDLAQKHAAEAREQRAELVRLAKSLNETCDHLERLNVELSEARQAAELARRLKAEFAATVGHELRTPVNLIIGFSELMVGPGRPSTYGEVLPDSYRGDIEAIHRNAGHISHLIDDILDLSQVDAHRMALHKEWITAAEVIQDAVANVEALCTDEGLSLTVDVAPDLPRVSADPVRIRQVLINLLYNGIRFTQQGGLRVEARSRESEVVISVVDTGAGIPPTELPRLFEEFRLTHPGSRGRGGSGLGLAVCKRFIELHAGNIWAESCPGRGSTFSFSLPLTENVVPTPAWIPPEHGARSTSHTRRLGVLDCSGESARVLQRYLDDYDVRPVPDPPSAAELVAQGEIEGLVLASRRVADEWHEFLDRHPGLPPLPTITCLMRTREDLAEVLQVSDYLLKPVTRERLAQALRRLEKPIRSVVVVDDDPEICELLVRMLRSLVPRARISQASGGISGLDLIQAIRPDVVLLDMLMPGLDGYGVIERLREMPELCATSIIVVTAKGIDEEIVSQGLEVTRTGGLPVGDTMRCLKASLDALLRMPGGAEQASQEAPRG